MSFLFFFLLTGGEKRAHAHLRERSIEICKFRVKSYLWKTFVDAALWWAKLAWKEPFSSHYVERKSEMRWEKILRHFTHEGIYATLIVAQVIWSVRSWNAHNFGRRVVKYKTTLLHLIGDDVTVLRTIRSVWYDNHLKMSFVNLVYT